MSENKTLYKYSTIITEDINTNKYINVYIAGDVDDKMYESFLSLYQLPDKIKNFHKVDEIRVNFSSGGGYCSYGFDIINFVESWNNNPELPKISFVASSKIMSMAVPIYASGYKRYSYFSTKFMLHDVSYGSYGYLFEQKESLKEAEMQKEDYIRYLVLKSNFSKEELEELMKGYKFFNCYEMRDKGLVDEII